MDGEIEGRGGWRDRGEGWMKGEGCRKLGWRWDQEGKDDRMVGDKMLFCVCEIRCAFFISSAAKKHSCQ